MSILKIRDADGNVQEVLAIRGEAGHTPERGVDYWTTSDKEQIVSDVIAELPNHGGGGDSGALDDHIADNSNPHKVTAEQIGAVTRDGFTTLLNEHMDTITERVISALPVYNGEVV